MIRQAADIIQDCFAEIGKCYRIGGDEFIVVCMDQEEVAVKAVLERLEHRVDQSNAELEPEKRLSLAYGYAFRETLQISLQQLFDQADRQMYLCKQAQKSTAAHS